MTDQAPDPKDDESASTAPPAYEPPRITESARFETLAQTCAYKDVVSCPANQIE